MGLKGRAKGPAFAATYGLIRETPWFRSIEADEAAARGNAMLSAVALNGVF